MGRVSKLLQRLKHVLRLDSKRSQPSTSSTIDLSSPVKKNKNPLSANVSAVPKIDPDAPLMLETAEVEGLFVAYQQFYSLQNGVVRAQEELEKQQRTVGDLTFKRNEALQDLQDFQYRSKNQGPNDKIRISPAMIAQQEVVVKRAKTTVFKAEKVLDDRLHARDTKQEALLAHHDKIIVPLEQKYPLEKLPLERLKAYFGQKKELADTRNEMLLSKLDVLARERYRAHKKWKSAVADADQQGRELRKKITQYNAENALIRSSNAKGKSVPNRVFVSSEIKNLTVNYMGARKIARDFKMKFKILDDEYKRVDAAVITGATNYAKLSAKITGIQNVINHVENLKRAAATDISEPFKDTKSLFDPQSKQGMSVVGLLVKPATKSTLETSADDTVDVDALVLNAALNRAALHKAILTRTHGQLKRTLEVSDLEVAEAEKRHEQQMAGLKASPKKSVTTIPLPSDLPVGAQEQTENDQLLYRLKELNDQLKRYESPFKTLEDMFKRLSADPSDKDYDANFAFVTGEWTRLHALRRDGLEEARKIMQQVMSQTSAANDTSRNNTFSAEVPGKPTPTVALAKSYMQSVGSVAPKSRVYVPTPAIDINVGHPLDIDLGQPTRNSDTGRFKIA